jgi:predicted nuclease with TOPRIM domain
MAQSKKMKQLGDENEMVCCEAIEARSEATQYAAELEAAMTKIEELQAENARLSESVSRAILEHEAGQRGKHVEERDVDLDISHDSALEAQAFSERTGQDMLDQVNWGDAQDYPAVLKARASNASVHLQPSVEDEDDVAYSDSEF